MKVKFRGKALDNGEWVTGSLVVGEVGARYASRICTDNGHWVFVDPGTIGRYFKTHKGRELYEGDIFATQSQGDPNTDAWNYDTYGYTLLRWLDDSDDGIPGWNFTNWWPTTEENSVYSWHYVMPAGNINENPGLLEDK